MDVLIHDIDAARMLMGEEIVSVYASTANLVVDPEGIEGFADNATVSFTFANGTTPTVDHHDALAAFRVALACQQSATEHRPVDLDELE